MSLAKRGYELPNNQKRKKKYINDFLKTLRRSKKENK